jgi:glycyl-tRNA synthetase alpha subunit
VVGERKIFGQAVFIQMGKARNLAWWNPSVGMEGVGWCCGGNEIDQFRIEQERTEVTEKIEQVRN